MEKILPAANEPVAAHIAYFQGGPLDLAKQRIKEPVAQLIVGIPQKSAIETPGHVTVTMAKGLYKHAGGIQAGNEVWNTYVFGGILSDEQVNAALSGT